MADLSTLPVPVSTPTAVQQAVLAATPAKQQDVAAASAAKIAALGPQDYRNFAITQATGSGRATSTQLGQDIASLSSTALQEKYPDQADEMLRNRTRAENDYRGDANSIRDGEGMASDAVSGFGLSTANLVGGIANFGAGLVSPKAAVWGSNQMDQLTKAIQGTQSQGLQDRRRAEEERSALAARDNQAQYEADVPTDGSFVAGLKSIGRGAMDTGSNILSDPILASDATFSGLGSLLTAGPMGEGIGLVGKGLLAAADMAGPATKSLAALDRFIPSKGMAALGMQEGTGAFNEAVSSVANMPQDQLNQSPYYQGLIAQGMSPDDARAQTARNEGLAASGPAALGGMAMSKLTGMDKVVHNPIPGIGQSLKQNAIQALREGTFEGGQSGTSTLSKNLAAQQYSDPNKAWSDDVGQQMAQGAIAGIGGAGVTEGPSTAAHVALSSMAGAGRAVMDRGRAIAANNQAASGVSDAKVQQAGQAAAASAPEAAATVAASTQDVPDATPDQHAAVADLSQKIVKLGAVDPAEIAQMPAEIQPIVTGTSTGPISRVDAVQRLADVVNKDGLSTSTGVAAAMEMRKQLANYENMINTDPDSFAAIPDEHPAGVIANQFSGLSQNILSSPKIIEALQKIQKGFTQEKADEVIQSPADTADIDQATADKAATVAAMMPDRVKPEMAQAILEQARNGKLQLTQDQHQALLASVALMSAAKTATDAQEGMGHDTPMAKVSDQVNTEKFTQGREKQSATGFTSQIFHNLRAGNVPYAAERLQRFGQFVQHMQNKVEAFNTNYAQGNKAPHTPYQALNQETGQWYPSKGVQVHTNTAGAAKSIQFAQQASMEAKMLADVYNNLSKAFPELKGGQKKATSLHEDLQGHLPTVAYEFHTGDRVRPTGSKPAATEPTKAAAETSTVTPTASMTDEALAAVHDELAPQMNDGTISTDDKADLADIEHEMEDRGLLTEPAAEPIQGEAEVKKSADGSNSAPVESKNETPVKAEPEAEAPKTTQEAYPNLYGSGDKPENNWFHKAFTMPKQAMTRVIGLASPLAAIRQALASDTALSKFVEGRDRSLPTPTVHAYKGYLGLVPAIMATMEKSLADKLTHQNTGGANAGATLGELFAKGKEVNRWSEGKVLNLVEQQADGSFKYNKNLLETAVLAGLQWLIVADQYGSKMDEDLVSSLTSIPAEDVSSNMVRDLGVGVSKIEAVRSLADKIESYWGLKANKDTDLSYTKGIPQAMAGEILAALVAQELLEKRSFVASQEPYGYQLTNKADPDGYSGKKIQDTDRFITVVQRGEPTEDGSKEAHPLLDNPHLIEEAVLKDPITRNYYGKDIPKASTHQMHQPMVENTPEQMKMLKAANAIPYRLNLNIHNLYQAIGLEGLQSWFGGGNIEGKVLNETDHKSLTSRNLSVQSALISLESRVAEMRTLEEGKADIEQVDIHFDHAISSVGRLQQQGPNNGQANKLVREAISPTWSTVDLRDEAGNAEHQKFFALAQAQALGIKIHTKALDLIYDDLTKTHEDLTPSIEILKAWNQSVRNGKGELPASAVQAIQKNFTEAKVDLTEVAFHALVEHARYLDSTEEEKQNFRTALYVEADGVANGTSNALMLLNAGEFSSHWVNNAARAGLSFNSDIKTMNDFRGTEAGQKDIYKVGADNTQATRDNLYNSYEGSQHIQDQMNHVTNMLSLLVPGVKVDFSTGVMSIDRGVTKNPMMITLYGSGAKGIAGNIVGEMMSSIYEKMSAAAQLKAQGSKFTVSQLMFDGDETKAKQFKEGFNALIDHSMQRVAVNGRMPKEPTYYETDLPARTGMDPTTFKVTKGEFQAIQGNILHLFVAPMRDAIEATLGGSLMASAKLVQSATQVQSIVLQHAYRDAVQVALKEREATDPTWRKGDFLSQNQLDDIQRKVLEIAPLIQTGTQAFYPASSQAADVGKNVSFGSDLHGEFRIPASIPGPANSGVRALPMLNIGMGDGKMMQVILGLLGVKGLPVFDGFNLALDKAAEWGTKINQAAHTAWQGNPLAEISTSYETFLEHTPTIKSMLDSNPALLSELAKALLPPWEVKNAASKQIIDALKGLGQDVKEGAESVAANQQAIREHEAHIDQMAATQTSYLNEGIPLRGTSQDMANALNARRNEILGKKAETQNTTTPAKPANTTSKAGVTIWYPTDIQSLLKGSKLTPAQRGILDPIFQSGALNGYSMVMGSRAELEQHHLGAGGDTLKPDPTGNRSGWINIGQKTIYAVSPDAETITHELIHAATFGSVLAHYTDGRVDGTGYRANAIERIATLMNQFLDMEVGGSKDHINAAIAIREHLNSPVGDAAMNKAAALNEYMAWVLANKELSDLHQKTDTHLSLVQMAKAAYEAIKQLIWGKRLVPPGKDMLSNLMFNTSVIISSPPTVVQANRGFTLYQNRVFGDNPRIGQLNQMFDERFARYLNPKSEALQAERHSALMASVANSADRALAVIGSRFFMTMQEKTLFQHVVTALSSEMMLDKNSLNQVDQLYQHVTRLLTPEMFIDKNDPDTQRAESYALDKFKLITGTSGMIMDANGRSSLMPVFLGLALVNDGFRQVLQDLPMPQAERNVRKGFDAWVENTANGLLHSLAEKMASQGKAANVQDAIDNLTNHIAATVEDRRSFVDQVTTGPNSLANWANDRAVTFLGKVSDTLMEKGQALTKNGGNPVVRGIGQVMNIMAAAVSEKNAGTIAEGVLSGLNHLKGFETFRKTVADIIGRQESNAQLFDLIKPAHALIQKVREEYRQRLPSIIASQFGRRLTNMEYSTAHMFMAHGDIASLTAHMSNKAALELLADPTKRRAAIRSLETQLQQTDPAHWVQVQEKAHQLANHMVTRGPGNNLLRNAEAVASLLNTSRSRAAPSQAYVHQLDQLITLYAMRSLGKNKANQKAMTHLVETQGKGMDFMLSHLTGNRKDDMQKASGSMAQLNIYKGHTPAMNQPGVSLRIADETKTAELLGMGYVKVGAYRGSTAESQREEKSYWYAPVSANSLFGQGIVQNIHQTALGVNVATGFTEGGLTAGRITNPAKVAAITKMLAREGNTTERLMPVFDNARNVIAYERAVDPSQLGRLNQDTHLGRMIGVVAGRIVEEGLAQNFNENAIDVAHAMYLADLAGAKGKTGDLGTYVDLNDPKSYGNDPIIKDAMKLMTPETRQYVDYVFGDKFYVRRDMIEDLIGARAASVGDAWTGNSRWSKANQERIQAMTMGIMGNDAYRYLVNGEKMIQNLASDARLIIVIKSVVVAGANLAGNFYQLVGRGLSATAIAKATPRKLAEINAYTKGQIREIEAGAHLRAAEGSGDVLAQHRLTAEIQALQDSYKRMSIWPLIEAGEFSAITDVGISRDDILMTNGKVSQYIDKLVDKLPPGLQTLAKYGMVSKDTALFQGLQKLTEYGDFLGKALYYDHLAQKKGLSQAEALGKVTEEFVHYDRASGRSRGYVESMGMAWFYHYKMRIAKVALSMIRDNPVQALIGAISPFNGDMIPGADGTPITDNIFAKAVRGTLGYSIGPGMGMRAPFLNPWVRIAY